LHRHSATKAGPFISGSSWIQYLFSARVADLSRVQPTGAIVMKRITQIFFFGLVLSISSVALAGQDHDRNEHRGYYGDQRHHAHQHDRNFNRRDGHRHIVRHAGHAPGHFHHGRLCNAWHPRSYVAPVVRYGYGDPGLVIVFQPGAGLYLGAGR